MCVVCALLQNEHTCFYGQYVKSGTTLQFEFNMLVYNPF